MTNLQKWLSLNESILPRSFSGEMDHAWTEYSIVVRLPEIARRVIQENSFPNEIEHKLNSLINEIPDSCICPLRADDGGDMAEWNSMIEPFTGLNWLEAPWIFVEFYFYRRILEAIGYFKKGEYFRFDPFQYQKMQGFQSSLGTINKLLEWVNGQKQEKGANKAILSKLLRYILEGNRLDLSLWPVNGELSVQPTSLREQNNQMMADDLAPALDWLFSRKVSRLDLLIDNAGFELLGDLCMADFLLDQRVIDQAVLHIKPYPIFVSDVINEDVSISLRLLAEQKDLHPELGSFAERVSDYLKTNKIRLEADLFWAHPLPFWNMPNHLYDDLASSDLIISKGDANYRRLLGDRLWDFGKPFSHVIGYMPSAMLAIRIIKSDAGVGYKPARLSLIKELDPDWMKDGKWGVIQFWNGE